MSDDEKKTLPDDPFEDGFIFALQMIQEIYNSPLNGAPPLDTDRIREPHKNHRERITQLVEHWKKGEERIAELEANNFHYLNTLRHVAKAVAVMWVAIQEGRYGSRSLVGDEVLSIAEALKEHALGPLAQAGIDGALGESERPLAPTAGPPKED